MKATLEFFDHRCTELYPCGDVLEATGSNRLVRKTILRGEDGKPKFMGNRADALAYAAKHDFEVTNAAE